MRVKKDKSYVVVSKMSGYVQGAFPRTKRGKKDAEEYVVKLNKKERTSEEYEIREQ